jgi:hypothetical protein
VPHQDFFRAVAAPTLVLGSSGDNYLIEDPMLRAAEHVTGPGATSESERWPPDATRRTERIDGLLLEFLG